MVLCSMVAIRFETSTVKSRLLNWRKARIDPRHTPGHELRPEAFRWFLCAAVFGQNFGQGILPQQEQLREPILHKVGSQGQRPPMSVHATWICVLATRSSELPTGLEEIGRHGQDSTVDIDGPVEWPERTRTQGRRKTMREAYTSARRVPARSANQALCSDYSCRRKGMKEAAAGMPIRTSSGTMRYRPEPNSWDVVAPVADHRGTRPRSCSQPSPGCR